MTVRNILVPICPHVAFDAQLDAALNIARRVEGHINAIFIRPDPRDVLAEEPMLALVAGGNPESLEQQGRMAEAAAKAKFNAWRSEHELASDMVDQSLRTPFARWSERIGPIEPTVVRCCRLSDLIVLNRPDSNLPVTQRAFDAAVFESGRPVLMVPQKVPDDVLRHVLVAWNGSREAARAIAGAMTLLHKAEEVSIFMTGQSGGMPPEDLDLAAFLTWHGILARHYYAEPDERPVGGALLRVAKKCGATMLVMGAYTHSRLRQNLLGGVTSHVLEHATLPVLMMH
jgi:hypothetical protein